MIDPHGNPPPIVDDSDRIIGIDRDIDRVAVSSERLIDRIVNNLIHQMVQSP